MGKPLTLLMAVAILMSLPTVASATSGSNVVARIQTTAGHEARPISAAGKNAKAHSPSAAHAAAADCSNTFWNTFDSAYAVFNRSDAAVRTGPSTSCTPPVGRIYNQYTVWYDCYSDGDDPGTGWSTWTHLHYWLNNAWHNGWVNDGLLPYQHDTQGSIWSCLQ